MNLALWSPIPRSRRGATFGCTVFRSARFFELGLSFLTFLWLRGFANQSRLSITGARGGHCARRRHAGVTNKSTNKSKGITSAYREFFAKDTRRRCAFLRRPFSPSAKLLPELLNWLQIYTKLIMVLDRAKQPHKSLKLLSDSMRSVFFAGLSWWAFIESHFRQIPPLLVGISGKFRRWRFVHEHHSVISCVWVKIMNRWE